MFIKSIVIPNKQTGKQYQYFRLCESYRVGGSPRHRTILNLGTLESLPDRKDHKLLADCIEQIVYKRPSLFACNDSPRIKQLAEQFAKIIINKKLLDVPQAGISQLVRESEADYQWIDISNLRHESVREIGAEWLCKQTLDRLGLESYLLELDWKERWIKTAMIYLIGRAVYPVSDHKSEDWLRRNTGLAELYSMEAAQITRHHLYKVSRMLYREKKNLESYLSARTGELFGLEQKIVLYDLTNTYFEGEMRGNGKALFGRSKEKRNDARLMALALVTDTAGFVKYSKIYEGNIKDSKTLQRTIEEIAAYDAHKGEGDKRVVVMDAGIATEDNLNMLRGQGYDYVCVALAKMGDYQVAEPESKPVVLRDKTGNKILVQWVKVEGKDDQILYVKSSNKRLKEAGMEALFCRRYEEGLQAIKKGIEKKGGIKRTDKVYERLGRLKEKYPSVNRYYQVNIQTQKGVATNLKWEKTAMGAHRQGVYFVRTTLPAKDEKTIWSIYNTIREIEATFRVLKTDLNMRPIFHQKDIYSESHIFGTILAYTLVNTIRHPLKAHGLHSDWRNITRTMNTQKIITTNLKTKTGKTIYLKKCSEPEFDVRQIYQILHYKDRPYWQKKSVLPKNGNPITQSLDTH